MRDDSRTLTVAEAAEILRIGKTAAYEAVRGGQIPAIRIGGRVLVLRRPFERMLDGAEPRTGVQLGDG